MDWPEELTGSLPSARDDEPVSLRQDIADELQDHLQSALQRQRLTTSDEGRARAQVVDRFGNPQHLARRLWFDAMQEKIMSQRLSLAITTLMGVSCLVAVGMMWHVSQQAQATARELIEEARATNQALLDRLTQLSIRSSDDHVTKDAQTSPEWNPFKAHLVIGEKNGPPAEGYIIRLSQKQSKGGVSQFETVAEERSDSDGVADLAPVQPGKYVLSAMGWNQGEWFSAPVIVLPNSTHRLEIVCPPSKLEKIGVVIRADVPEDLRHKNVYLTAEMILGPRDFSGSEWRTGFSGAEAYDGLAIIIIAPDGRVGVSYQGIMQHTNKGEPLQMLPAAGSEWDFAKPEDHPLTLFVTDHYLRTIRIGTGYGSVAGQPNGVGSLAIKSEWHFLAEDKRIYPGTFLDYRVASRDLRSLQRFEFAHDGKTEWHLDVPAEFWNQARADLERAQRMTLAVPTQSLPPY